MSAAPLAAPAGREGMPRTVWRDAAPTDFTKWQIHWAQTGCTNDVPQWAYANQIPHWYLWVAQAKHK